MTRYYFDTEDGELYHRDTDGTDFAGLEFARAAATMAMSELCREYLPQVGSERRSLKMVVRDDKSVPVMQLTVTFSVSSLV
jgi:hypothetical protein